MVTLVLACGMLGMLAGGPLCDFATGRLGPRWGRVVPVVAGCLLAGSAYLGCLVSPSVWGVVACCGVVRGVLGDRPKAVAAVTRIFLDGIETLLGAQQATPPSTRPQLGAVSFLHRFGSGLNRHAHLHAAVTDGVFLPGPHGRDGPSYFQSLEHLLRYCARRVAATSGSEETAGRSRLTSNRRFASGRRPGWLHPREVIPSRTSANRSNRPARNSPTGQRSRKCH